MQNKVQLITYADRFGGFSLSELHSFLAKHFSEHFAGVHLLPFFYPIDGADAGYDPHDNRVIDPRLGKWSDLKKMSADFDLMGDLIVNHISDQSNEFKDVLDKGSASLFLDMFLTKEKVYGPDANPLEIGKIFRPRPSPPFTSFEAKTGEVLNFWTTFSSNQVDLDINSPQSQQYLDSVLDVFAENGISQVRLDAVGYAVKKAGSSCFMLPETYRFIDQLVEKAHLRNLKVLTEIHSHYQTQIDISKHTDYVYDFALPPLLIYCIERKTLDPLFHWIGIRPNNTITVLDTHDGIGVMDLAANGELPGLLDPDEIDFLVEQIHTNTNNQSRLATGEAASNLDIYQVNSTYYDALGKNDTKYLIARAIQFFLPGIPQVYYMGLLAINNDVNLLKKTGVGRDINRSYLSQEEILKAAEKGLVKGLLDLIHLRNTHPAFEGSFSYHRNNNILILRWVDQGSICELEVDFNAIEFRVKLSDGDVIVFP